MIESDWKKFRDMVPTLRERYLADRNTRLAAVLVDPAKNQTQRFWDAMEEMEKEAKVLRQCLDGHSRSKMWLYMLTMIRDRVKDSVGRGNYIFDMVRTIELPADVITRASKSRISSTLPSRALCPLKNGS